MADMDWGWKRKRSMIPPLADQLVDDDDVADYDDVMDLPVVEVVDKKSLASLHDGGKRTPENVNGE